MEQPKWNENLTEWRKKNGLDTLEMQMYLAAMKEKMMVREIGIATVSFIVGIVFASLVVIGMVSIK